MARGRLVELGLTQRRLVALCGWADNAGASKVCRALNGEVTTLDTIEAISGALGIPRPFVTFETADDALLVEGQLAVRLRMRTPTR
jgi:hypothetical protein